MRIELAPKSCCESLADLLCELHSYYNEGSTVSREVVYSYLLDNLLTDDSPLHLVVAVQDDGQVAGLAAIAVTYSLVEPTPERRRHCWLKELYVRQSSRSRGIGRALMRWVAGYAVEQGCCRIDWPVKESNIRGIAFYESLGAKRVSDRLSYRLSEPGLSRLAGCPESI